ncbi:hypothetical protein DFJ77DRAFT_462999 [Powellomyces hirtus]|nr:hypothetical protein DFJ77DRAFT_462999 [Powellomyces hirtus]
MVQFGLADLDLRIADQTPADTNSTITSARAHPRGPNRQPSHRSRHRLQPESYLDSLPSLTQPRESSDSDSETEWLRYESSLDANPEHDRVLAAAEAAALRTITELTGRRPAASHPIWRTPRARLALRGPSARSPITYSLQPLTDNSSNDGGWDTPVSQTSGQGPSSSNNARGSSGETSAAGTTGISSMSADPNNTTDSDNHVMRITSRHAPLPVAPFLGRARLVTPNPEPLNGTDSSGNESASTSFLASSFPHLRAGSTNATPATTTTTTATTAATTRSTPSTTTDDQSYVRIVVLPPPTTPLMTPIPFKIRRTAPLEKLFESYCKRTGQSLIWSEFLFGDERVGGWMTAEALGVEKDAVIRFVERAERVGR